ncbi:MAG: phosphatidate cytidylyltransferase [Halanaerobiales bacterium]|nr:phosphatidate cytidylyltransferase [Halanaerobiales bacterium]
MLTERLISAVIGIILFIFFIFWGSLPFSILILIITALAVIEYNSMLPLSRTNNYLFLLIFSLIIIIYTYLTNRGFINLPHGITAFIFLFAFLLYHIIADNNYGLVNTLGNNLLGVIYIGGGMAFFPLLRDFALEPFDRTKALWLVLIATWATDTGAYFIGRLLGKNKLAEKISPNKTVEGAIGGIMLSILLVSIYTSFLKVFSYYWLIYGLLVSLIAIAGDLFESSIKRDMGVKDSGRIIPGHGGILDRFDSLLFAVPFTYYFLKLVL